jgi:hypothetical protein
MAGRPRLLPFVEGSNCSVLWLNDPLGFSLDESVYQERVLLAAFQITPASS